MTTSVVEPLLRPPTGGEQSLFELVRASRLRSVAVGVSKDPNAKIMILLVDPATEEAVLAVKAPTTDAAEAAVDAERAILDELAAAAPPALARTIPRVVGTVDHGGRRALVTTALAGRSMATCYAQARHTRSEARVGRDFAAVERWLELLQGARVSGASPVARDTAERLRRRFDDVPESTLERAAELDDLLGAAVDTTAVVHGDFWFGNVLLVDGAVSGIVDWEAGAAAGDSTRDAARFAHIYALYLDRQARPGRPVPGHRGLHADGFGAAVAFALDGSGWFPDLFRRFLGRALVRAGGSWALWRSLALSGIAEMAACTDHDEFARLHLELFTRLCVQRA